MRKRRTNVNGEDELSDVNVTPLADVSLTLVIMIMVISPMVFQSMIQVQPSQVVAMDTKTDKKDAPLFVDVTPGGFTLNNRPLSSEYELFRKLQRSLSHRRDKTVLISASKKVPYHKVIRTLDIVKQSGALSLSLVPRQKKG